MVENEAKGRLLKDAIIVVRTPQWTYMYMYVVYGLTIGLYTVVS